MEHLRNGARNLSNQTHRLNSKLFLQNWIWRRSYAFSLLGNVRSVQKRNKTACRWPNLRSRAFKLSLYIVTHCANSAMLVFVFPVTNIMRCVSLISSMGHAESMANFLMPLTRVSIVLSHFLISKSVLSVRSYQLYKFIQRHKDLRLLRKSCGYGLQMESFRLL